MQNLDRRLTALEERQGGNRISMVIRRIVDPGPPKPSGWMAKCDDGRQFAQRARESLDAFESRVVAEVGAVQRQGIPTVIFDSGPAILSPAGTA